MREGGGREGAREREGESQSNLRSTTCISPLKHVHCLSWCCCLAIHQMLGYARVLRALPH